MIGVDSHRSRNVVQRKTLSEVGMEKIPSLAEPAGRAAFNQKRPPEFTGRLRRRGKAWDDPAAADAERLDEAYRSGEF